MARNLTLLKKNKKTISLLIFQNIQELIKILHRMQKKKKNSDINSKILMYSLAEISTEVSMLTS